MAKDVNTVALTGRVTRDLELRAVGQDGTAVVDLPLAVNGSQKVGDEWVEKANFVDVTVWAGQAENCDKYLHKGSRVAVSGSLDYQSWETPEGQKRSKIVIGNAQVVFLDPKPASPVEVVADSEHPVIVSDEDIPF